MAARPSEVCGERFDRCQVDVAGDDVGASLDEPAHDCLAQSLAGSGDDGTPTGQRDELEE